MQHRASSPSPSASHSYYNNDQHHHQRPLPTQQSYRGTENVIPASSSTLLTTTNNNNNRSSSVDGGLSGVAAQLDAINPMFKSMRDLERRKQQEVHSLEDRLHQKDLEIIRLNKMVDQLKNENQKLKNAMTMMNNQDPNQIDSLLHHPLSSSSTASASFQHHQQSLMRERQLLNAQAAIAGTNLGTALSPKQMNVPRHNNLSNNNNNLTAPSFANSPPMSSKQQTHHQQNFNNNNNNNSNNTGMNTSSSSSSTTFLNNNQNQNQNQQNTNFDLLQKQQQQQEKERQDLEEMLSRSIGRLAEAERALVSERTRFLVVDPGLISMDRWRAAVSRLADLHDEVAHRRFGACLAAARLSGQLPDDTPQVIAAQFLRSSLSPIVLQLIANCFRKKEKEHETLQNVFDEMDRLDDDELQHRFLSSSSRQQQEGIDDLVGGRRATTTSSKMRSDHQQQQQQKDPWRDNETGLVEEPDVLLHHVNCILERLTLDPGDDYVQ